MTGAAKSERTVDLAATGVPTLLFELLSQRFTGELVIEPATPQEGRVGFVGGLARWCEADLPDSRLGELLVKSEAIAADDLDAALSGRTPGQRLGEQLVAAESVSAEQVADALRLQCRRRVAFVCKFDEGTARLMSGVASRVAEDFPEVGVLPIIREGVRDHCAPAQLDEAVAPVLTGAFAASAALQKYAPHFEFTAAEEIGVAALPTDGAITFDEWVADSGLDGEAAKRLLYSLYVCKMVTVADTSAESSTPSGEVSSPRRAVRKTAAPPKPRPGRRRPVPLRGDGEALAAEIEKRWAVGDDAYAFLGVEPDATLAAIRGKIADLEQRLMVEPSAPEDDEEANDDEGASTGAPPPPEVDASIVAAQETLTRVLEAAEAVRKKICKEDAGALLAAEQWATATPLFEDLLQFNKGHVPTRVALAWIRFHTSTRTTREAQRAADALDLLIGVDPEYADAYYYRGYMLVELDRPPVALRAFEKALELDPLNTDAARQAQAIRSGKKPSKARAERAAAKSKPAEFKVKKRVGTRHPYWSGPWPAIWIFAGLAVTALLAAQFVLRLDRDF